MKTERFFFEGIGRYAFDKAVVIACGFDSEMKRKFVSMGLANMVG